MDSTIINNPTIVYDPNIISQIKEMIEKGLIKLKSFAKIKQNNLEFYHDLCERFNEIALKLKQLKLWEELKYFNSISLQIEYIVYQNSLNPDFGHSSFAIEIFDFYIEFIKTNFDFYLDLSDMTPDEFALYKDNAKMKHRRYRRKFLRDIYQLSGDYTEDELYNIHESLRV